MAEKVIVAVVRVVLVIVQTHQTSDMVLTFLHIKEEHYEATSLASWGSGREASVNLVNWPLGMGGPALTIEIQSATAHPIIAEILLVSAQYCQYTICVDHRAYRGDLFVCAGPNQQIDSYQYQQCWPSTRGASDDIL